MTQSSPERKPCGTCGEEFTVTAAGGMRSHFTDNPDFQADPDNRKCKGAGQPPATAAGVALAEDMEADGPQCRLCRHPVQLYGNGRVRSHLTPEQTPRPCPAGSDFPLGVYPDIAGTTDGLVATLARDCGHVPAGECYACAGVTVPAAETQVTSSAPWGVNADSVDQPTMADQLEASVAGQRQQVHDAVPLLNRGEQPTDDGRPQASRFTELLAQETRGTGTVLDRIDPAVFRDHRTEAQKAHDAETSRLTREAIKVLEQRTPEQKAETAARMDRTASAALGLPLDPALNHQYTDRSGTVWVHEGPEETCQAPDCVLMRGRPAGFDPDCEKCDTDNHRCPGCGTDVPHGTVACVDCTARVAAEDAERQAKCSHPDGFQAPLNIDGRDVPACEHCNAVQWFAGPDPADEWRTPAHMVRDLMPEDVQMLDAMRLNCADCKHPVTPLVDQFALDGRAAVVTWACEPHITSSYQQCNDHACKPDVLVRLGDLDEGDHFVRRGALMRVTERESATSVLAEVVDGPHKGRTGELKNLSEVVERAPEPRTTKEQETKECPDNTEAATSPRSSLAPATPTADPTTAPAPGSPQPSKASAPAAGNSSTSATSSAPTAKASTNGRSAAVKTDQSAAAASFLGGSRPAAPAQPGPANPADAAAQFLAGGSGAHGEKETKRDRFGRYLIPHPDTGKEQAWTRATTFAKSISDTYALSQWGLRMALLGATVRPDIVQRAHGKHVKADKQLLDELTADLKNAAGDKVAANLGTSMHSFTEMADRAWHSPGGPLSILDQVPPEAQGMVVTYINLLQQTGLEPVPHLIEFTTVVKQYGVAGTSDNCYKVTRPLTLKIGRAEVRLEPGEYVIGDKKTGKDLDYGWQEIAIQLGTYAQGINTAGVWDRHEEVWHPDPLSRFDAPGTKVRLDAGIVIHLPVDKESEKQPAVYGVDLESGWNAAVLCERVRTWRKVRNLSGPVMVSEAETFEPRRTEPAVTTRTTIRPPSLKDKANAITSKGEASAVWKEAKAAGLSESETDELVALMQARLAKLSEPGG